MNAWGAERRPFLFVIDFEMTQPLVIPLVEIDPAALQYHLNDLSNATVANILPAEPVFERYPMPFSDYLHAFNAVQYHLHAGDTYLLNLTFPTPILTNIGLKCVFDIAQAPYRLWINNCFVVFSPECFVRIENGQIASYPMKGTIAANLPKAEAQLMDNPKEKAEHATIVDLIRNDLSMVSSNVRVTRYRYPEVISTHNGPLLQTSSQITGILPADFAGAIGDIIFQLLPAGSISGAPKQKTVNIIQAVEAQPRGYYTGVFGVFDGERLESAVMIRFIEQTPSGLVFRSGGGITANSKAEEEYAELVQKVYLPLHQFTPSAFAKK
ncbi:MAG: aminodeoxychorismate synthase component I [Saprospiraceae bacterium]|nr:aminodeoxychorismate synthase component I [Saprospiraceae bacterium]